MVTSREFARGMVRTMRAIDREAKRAQRQRVAFERNAQKQAFLEASAATASEYDRMIAELVRPHAVSFVRRDWLTAATAAELDPPAPGDTNERAAMSALHSYEPGWFVRTFGFEARRRAALEQRVAVARAADGEAYSLRVQEVQAHNESVRFAQRLVARDHEAIGDALDNYSRLGELPFSVEAIDVLFTDDDRIIAMVDGLDLEDMPDQSVTLLQSGKVSVKSLAKGKVLELHKLNICGSAVRVAIEFLKVLPIDAVEVVMHSDILDRAAGHIQNTPVLYLRATPQALASVNLNRADADALIDRLGGHYEWSKRDGFRQLNLAPFDIPDEPALEG